MFRRFDLAIFLVILLVICCTVAFAGKVELTTYYPAPVGEYTTLSAKGKDTSNSTAFQAGGSAGTGLVVTNANNVGIGTAAPVAALEVTSTTSGFIPPRVTEDAVSGQRGDITAPVLGMMVFNITKDYLEVYTSDGWKPVGGTGMIKEWGKIQYDGVILAGSGNYTVTRFANGRYYIDFTASAPDRIAIFSLYDDNHNTRDKFFWVDSDISTATRLAVSSYDVSDANEQDHSFSFVTTY